jgi:mono/diheme cytochrome c family protein
MEMPPMGIEEQAAAAADYQKYCALCHGADRKGYANDDAPSLGSESLMRSGYPTHILYAVAYGRRGTPMGGYFDEIGGPLNRNDLYRLIRWLKEQVGVDFIDLPLEPVNGDVELGREVYDMHCAVCHGDNGEGKIGPAIGNPAMLSLTTDSFLKYAIENGRDGTQMPSFSDTLTLDEINGVTAFLRSRSSGWTVEKPVLREDLNRALEEKRRLVLLDTRVPSMWQMANIEGSVPVPYYFGNFDGVAEDLPTDGTWIVIYCECPRASAESVNFKLRERGFKNTAVLWEGIQGWVALGYPVSVGQSIASEPSR